MPALDGAAEWLNSEPPGPADLRGHVVLGNFWTLTCINWLRTESYVPARSHWDETDGSSLVSPSAGMARFALRKTRQLDGDNIKLLEPKMKGRLPRLLVRTRRLPGVRPVHGRALLRTAWERPWWSSSGAPAEARAR
jgi:hypothetical protein